MRIISLVPSHTEILFSLGLGEQVVGVSENCDYPQQAQQKEKIGYFAQPKVDMILTLKPDLVVAGGKIHRSCIEELRRGGIGVFDFAPRSVPELIAGISELAQVTKSKEGTLLVDELKKKFELTVSKREGLQSPRAVFLMGSKRMVTPGPATCQYDALKIAGLEQIPLDADLDHALITWEDVATFNPEIILACGRPENWPAQPRCPGCSIENPPCSRSIEEIKKRVKQSVIAAVKKEQVYAIPCHFFCRPGPRLFNGIDWLLDKLNRAYSGRALYLNNL